MNEKLIKITVRMVDGKQKKFRCTNFQVSAARDGGEIYLKIDNKESIVCQHIQVEQKEIEGAFCL